MAVAPLQAIQHERNCFGLVFTVPFLSLDPFCSHSGREVPANVLSSGIGRSKGPRMTLNAHSGYKLASD